jgi:hypothetical protein
VTSRYFGLENKIVMVALWIADEGLVKGEEERRQLQLHCAICFDFNLKLSSGTINVIVERVLGYDTTKYQVAEIPDLTISCVLYKRYIYGIYPNILTLILFAAVPCYGRLIHVLYGRL